MCNQQGHVNFDKVNDIVINDTNTAEVMIIDDNCFEKAKLNGKQIMFNACKMDVYYERN